jgi:Zn-dependent protease with chaperone function
MGMQAIPYDPYHPHVWYTLAVTCLAWIAIAVYSQRVLRNQPRARVALLGVGIALPLFAEVGSYLIFVVRPAPESPMGALLSNFHAYYLQLLPLDTFFAPSIVIGAVLTLSSLLIVSLVRFIVGSVRLEALLRLGEPIDVQGYDELVAELHTIAATNSLRLPPIDVLPLDQPLAFTVGLLRPRIYIADGMLALLTDEEALAVFCHELAHVQRRDNLWNWAVRLLRDTAWFLPFSHAGWRLMVHSQDEACDALAVQFTGDPLSLARALVKVAGAWRNADPVSMSLATPFALARADVRSRVEQMIALSDHSELTPAYAIPGAYALGGVLLMLSVLPSLLGS